LSWQIAPAVAAGTIAMARTSSTAMIALTSAEPTAAYSWIELSRAPLKWVSQITVMAAKTLATSKDRPA
jgi:hypothetical protein